MNERFHCLKYFTKEIKSKLKLHFLVKYHPDTIISSKILLTYPNGINKINMRILADCKINTINSPRIVNYINITTKNRISLTFRYDLYFINYIITFNERSL